MDAIETGLLTINKKSIKELFTAKLRAISENLADPMTSKKDKRKITLEFTFSPFPDRSGCQVEVKCKTNLGDIDTSGLTENLYLAKHEGQYCLFSRDLRQEMLFEEEKPQDGKTAAGGQ